MALFGGGNAQQGLALRITESGAEQVTGKLNRLAGATDRVDRAATKGVGGFTRIGAAMGKLRGVATGLLGIFGRVGGLLGIGGAFAVGGLIGETLSIERNLRRIQYQGNLSAEAMRRMRDTMNQVAGNTGKSRAEVVAAIDVANDLGLSLEEAEKHMEQMALWSDLLGVSTDQAIGAVASIKRAVGDGASVDEIMSMVNAAAMNAGMDEGMFMNLVSKVGSQLQGMAGLADITSFFQAIAGIGEEFAGDPRVLQSAFKSLNRYMSNDKLMSSLNKVGVKGKNAAELFLSMAQLLERDSHALDRAGLPDEVLAIAQAMVGNGERINKMGVAVDTAAGDVVGFSTRVKEHAKDPEVAWAGTMERLKQAMQPLITGVLDWVVANKENIVGAFQSFISGLQEVMSWLKDWWPAALAAALAGKALPALGGIGAAAGAGAGGAAVATGALAVTAVAGVADMVMEYIDAGEQGRLPRGGIVGLVEDQFLNPIHGGQRAREQAGANAENDAMRAEQDARRMYALRTDVGAASLTPEGQALQQAGASGIASVIRGVFGGTQRTQVGGSIQIRTTENISAEADVRVNEREVAAVPAPA